MSRRGCSGTDLLLNFHPVGTRAQHSHLGRSQPDGSYRRIINPLKPTVVVLAAAVSERHPVPACHEHVPLSCACRCVYSNHASAYAVDKPPNPASSQLFPQILGTPSFWDIFVARYMSYTDCSTKCITVCIANLAQIRLREAFPLYYKGLVGLQWDGMAERQAARAGSRMCPAMPRKP